MVLEVLARFAWKEPQSLYYNLVLSHLPILFIMVSTIIFLAKLRKDKYKKLEAERSNREKCWVEEMEKYNSDGFCFYLVDGVKFRQWLCL